MPTWAWRIRRNRTVRVIISKHFRQGAAILRATSAIHLLPCRWPTGKVYFRSIWVGPERRGHRSNQCLDGAGVEQREKGQVSPWPNGGPALKIRGKKVPNGTEISYGAHLRGTELESSVLSLWRSRSTVFPGATG